MDESLEKIFEIIDSLDADDIIKNFYKDLVLFESKNTSISYKREYERIIKSHMGGL